MRGYRGEQTEALLKEHLAAALIGRSEWRKSVNDGNPLPFYDPFCGSGTIPIEATLYAFNVAPGFGRRFAIENLPIYNARRAEEIRRNEASLIRTDVEVRITGSDIDSAAVERSRKNAEYACVMAGRALQSIGSDAKVPRPDFVQADFSELTAPYPTGLILCNPPYGERLGDEEEAEALYRKMKCLRDEFSGWNFGVITAHKKFQENFGAYASLLKDLKAGNLDTTLYIYRNREERGGDYRRTR